MILSLLLDRPTIDRTIPPTQEASRCDGNMSGKSWSMIRKTGYRFSEKIMLKQKDRAG
jgi:hypothetical protein